MLKFKITKRIKFEIINKIRDFVEKSRTRQKLRFENKKISGKIFEKNSALFNRNIINIPVHDSELQKLVEFLVVLQVFLR